MARPNFQYEKRQRDLVKKKKQEEKRQRKLDKAKLESGDNPEQSVEAIKQQQIIRDEIVQFTKKLGANMAIHNLIKT